MSTFDASSILSAASLNAGALKTVLESSLPVKVYSDTHTTIQSISSATPADLHSISIDVEADEAVLLLSSVAVSGSNTADDWYLYHDLSGFAGYEQTGRFRASASLTGGNQTTVSVLTLATDPTAGSQTAKLIWRAVTAPSGTLYSAEGITAVLRFKRR